jgi:pimeloyl-ACP methyl ester carboxylesterase
MQSEMIEANGLSFHCLTAGDTSNPLLLMLHGFPEYSGAWTEMMDRLSGDFFCVAPDQRGYNLSSKPPEVADYAARKLVADAVAILDHYRPGGAARAVIGHDWGAAVAYAMAMRAPKRMERLIIVNGVHPIPFQTALAAGGAQTKASQYMLWLRREGSEDVLAKDAFGKLEAVFSAKMDLSWLQGPTRDAYRKAWGQPGAMRGMVNWYRASPMAIPAPGASIPVPEMPRDAMRIHPPHLLIWGMGDTALLPESRIGLDALCDDLTVLEIADADHWIIHEKPDEVAAAIRDFVA